MPITAFLVGYETGFSFSDRELFTFEGWRMIHNGRWGLRRWSDNNPALTTTVSSQVKSLVVWTVSRYGYEIRVNGEVLPQMFPVTGVQRRSLTESMEILNGWQEKFFFTPGYWN